MMKKTSLFVLLTMVLVTSVFATQGKYTRKSVSSVESVWIKPDAVQGVEFDNEFFEKMVDFYIEVERFDYNVLPKKMTKGFKKEVTSLTDFSPKKIGEIMEQTVVKEIVDILNDPAVKQKRGLANKDEADFETFAATKAKSLGLTTEEMKVLMNSAYIYLPFITSMVKEVDKKNNIGITIEGGILWYHVIMDKDGNTSLKQVVAATTKGIGGAKVGENYTFRFGKETEKVDANTQAQYDAIQAWAKNLGVKTKKIDDFKLTAQIVEADGKNYSFPLGHREGIFLDDGFDVVEYMEDDEGRVVAERIGFVRVSKTGDNENDPTSYTFAKQYLGETTDVGAVVMEHPVLGIDLNVKPFFSLGMSIPKNATILPGNITPILKDDATSAIGVEGVFSYNLAPIVGVSQLFYDISIGFGLPTSTYNEGAEATVSVISAYMGASKKLWFTRTNLNFGIAGGMDMLSMSGKYASTDFTYGLRAFGVKADAEFEYMWNADWSINFGAGYKLGLAPSSAKYTWGSYEAEIPVSGEYEDVNLGGINLNLGVSYALGELPFNLFGFLDPLKKH